MIAQRFTTTNNGTPQIGTDQVIFSVDDATRWGLYVCYGIRGNVLVAEVDGAPLAIYQSKLTGDDAKAIRKIRKAVKVSGSALDYVRKTAKTAAVVWGN